MVVENGEKKTVLFLLVTWKERLYFKKSVFEIQSWTWTRELTIDICGYLIEFSQWGVRLLILKIGIQNTNFNMRSKTDHWGLQELRSYLIHFFSDWEEFGYF